MTLPYEEAGPTRPAPSVLAATKATQDQHSRPTQYFTVLNMLMEADEACSSEFYRAYLPRFSVAIHRARRDGYVISKRPCDRRDHDHRGTCWLYRLEALPELGR